jgi:hypothetical protein
MHTSEPAAPTGRSDTAWRQDWMPLDELNPLIDDFLGTSGIVFGIKDSRVPDWPPLINGEVGQIFRYMTTETGGQYF